MKGCGGMPVLCTHFLLAYTGKQEKGHPGHKPRPASEGSRAVCHALQLLADSGHPD